MYDAEVLYVIEHVDSGMTKIGITGDWLSRSRALKLHEKTRLVGLFEPGDMQEAEKELHALFRRSRLPGSEYFSLTKDQQEELLARAREDYREMEDLTGIYRQMASKSQIDVTKAIHWSAHDWTRLNRTSWKRMISCICSYPEDDLDIQFENSICKDQIQEMAKEINDVWGLGASEQIASERICCEFFRHHKVSLDKKLFTRHSYGRGYGFRFHLKPEIDDNLFDYLIFNPTLENANIKVAGIEVKPQTLSFFLRRWAGFRGKKYCDEAMNALVEWKRFDYYLSCLGPMTTDWVD